MSELKQYEKTFLKRINELKKEINNLSQKIDEVKIAKNEIDKKIRIGDYFIKEKKLQNSEYNKDEIDEDIFEKNNNLQEEIDNYNMEIKSLGEEIQNMREHSFEVYQDIENLKNKCDILIKANLNLEKNVNKKEKEGIKLALDIKKINDKIHMQEINSEQFLKNIEKMANKEKNTKKNAPFEGNNK